MEIAEKQGLVILIELYIGSLKKQQNDSQDHFNEFADEVVKLRDLGEVSEEDILKLQSKEYLGLSKFMRLSGRLNKSTVSGFTYEQALELGHKIQFAALSYAQENEEDGHRAFANSMKPHEDGIDAIFHGTYDKTKLEILQSLPSISNWDHKLGADAWINFLKS